MGPRSLAQLVISQLETFKLPEVLVFTFMDFIVKSQLCPPIFPKPRVKFFLSYSLAYPRIRACSYFNYLVLKILYSRVFNLMTSLSPCKTLSKAIHMFKSCLAYFKPISKLKYLLFEIVFRIDLNCTFKVFGFQANIYIELHLHIYRNSFY